MYQTVLKALFKTDPGKKIKEITYAKVNDVTGVSHKKIGTLASIGYAAYHGEADLKHIKLRKKIGENAYISPIFKYNYLHKYSKAGINFSIDF